jgi:hypothetical protein
LNFVPKLNELAPREEPEPKSKAADKSVRPT